MHVQRGQVWTGAAPWPSPTCTARKNLGSSAGETLTGALFSATSSSSLRVVGRVNLDPHHGSGYLCFQPPSLLLGYTEKH